METSSTQENTQEATQGTETPQAHVYSEAEYNALKVQLDTAKSQLDTANAEIQSYKDMDIDNIKASVAEYKQKFEQSEADRKAFEHKTKLDAYVKTLGLRDDIYEQHVTNLLLEKGLQFDGDKLIGGDDVVKAFRANHESAFTPTENKPEFVSTATGAAKIDPDDAQIRKIMGLK